MTGLSIIVPVFNTEETLNRCVKSILAQGLTNTEIILVDDGSADNCPELCDQWAANVEEIKVIHKPNGGLSDARNAGIERASKQYITFVDSDDFLAPNTFSRLKKILDKHPEYDIIEYPICHIRSSQKEYLQTFQDKEYSDARRYWLEEKAYNHSFACNKVFRKSLFEDVKFPIGKAFEDMATIPQLLKKTRHIATTCIGQYNYCWNPNGITANAKGDEWESLLDSHLKIISEMAFTTSHEQEYYLHVLNIQLYTCLLTGSMPKLANIRISNWRQIRPIQMAIKALLLNLLGIKNLCQLYKIQSKIWRNH